MRDEEPKQKELTTSPELLLLFYLQTSERGRQYVPNRRGACCQALRVWLPLTVVPVSSVDLVVQWEFVLLVVRAPRAGSCLGIGGAEKGT